MAKVGHWGQNECLNMCDIVAWSAAVRIKAYKLGMDVNCGGDMDKETTVAWVQSPIATVSRTCPRTAEPALLLGGKSGLVQRLMTKQVMKTQVQFSFVLLDYPRSPSDWTVIQTCRSSPLPLPPLLPHHHHSLRAEKNATCTQQKRVQDMFKHHCKNEEGLKFIPQGISVYFHSGF